MVSSTFIENGFFLKDIILNDVIINAFMCNRNLYDKAEKEYHYTTEKIQKLKEICLFLREVDVHVTGKCNLFNTN